MLTLSQPASIAADSQRHMTSDVYLADARTIVSLGQAREMYKLEIADLIGSVLIDDELFEVTTSRGCDEIHRLERMVSRIDRARAALLGTMPGDVREALGLPEPASRMDMDVDSFHALIMAVNRHGVEIDVPAQPRTLISCADDEPFGDFGDFGQGDLWTKGRKSRLDDLDESIELSYEMDEIS